MRDQLQALAVAMSPYRVNARPVNRTSRITLMPSPVMVGEPLPPSLDRLASGGRHALTLVRGGRSATVMITEEDLARGVVIGRSEKCHTEMLRRITDENTSRVHILVLREGEIVYAYDLASTQGTYVNGMPARRVVLSDSGRIGDARGAATTPSASSGSRADGRRADGRRRAYFFFRSPLSSSRVSDGAPLVRSSAQSDAPSSDSASARVAPSISAARGV